MDADTIKGIDYINKIDGPLIKSCFIPTGLFTMPKRINPCVFQEYTVKNGWHMYRKLVRELTELSVSMIPGIENRGFTNHHVDHIISIWKGFKLGIEPEKIADISNLMMLPYRENMRKGVR